MMFSIQQLLTERSLFQPLRQTIQLLQTIQDHIILFFPPHQRAACTVSHLKNHQLFLLTSSALATELRFQQHDFLEYCRTLPDLQNLQSVHCSVKPFSMSSTAQDRASSPPCIASPPILQAILRELAPYRS